MGLNQYGAPTVGNAGLDSPEYTSGWNVQTSTDDLEEGGGEGTSLGLQGNLNGYLAQTMAAENALSGGFSLPVTNTFYGVLTYIPQGKSTKFYTGVSAAGGATHAYVAVVSLAGAPLAVSADLTSLSTGAGSWASAYTFEPGLYYVGVAVTWATTQTTFDGMAIHGATATVAPGITYSTSAGTYPRLVSVGSLTLTSTFPTSLTLAADTGAKGAPFVGIY